MARLVEYHARDDSYPGLEEVIDRVLDVTWYDDAEGSSYLARVDEAVERVVLDRMMAQAVSPANGPHVRAILGAKVGAVADRLEGRDDLTPHQRLAAEDIRRWQARRDELAPVGVPELPPGSPIGERSGTRR